MKISTSINQKNLQEITIKSLVWNSLIEVFLEEKNIDIKKYLVSISLKGSIIFVKTNKNIINSELIILDEIIKKRIEKKISKIGIIFKDFELKYII